MVFDKRFLVVVSIRSNKKYVCTLKALRKINIEKVVIDWRAVYDLIMKGEV